MSLKKRDAVHALRQQTRTSGGHEMPHIKPKNQKFHQTTIENFSFLSQKETFQP